MKLINSLIVIVLLATLVSACGTSSTSETSVSTPIPQLSPTPASTPIPAKAVTQITILHHPGGTGVDSFNDVMLNETVTGESVTLTRYGGEFNDNKVVVKDGKTGFQETVNLESGEATELGVKFLSWLGIVIELNEDGDVIVSNNAHWEIVE